MFVANHQWLLDTETPKIMFHATPGLLMPPACAHFYAAHLTNCHAIDLGAGNHHLPENQANTTGTTAAWLSMLG
jgi:haloalkane dehalogenase